MPRRSAKARAAIEREGKRAEEKQDHRREKSTSKRSVRSRAASVDADSDYAPSEAPSEEPDLEPELDLEAIAYQDLMLNATDSEEENDDVWYEAGQAVYPLFRPNAWQNMRIPKPVIPKKRKSTTLPAQGKKRGPYTKNSRTTKWRQRKRAVGYGDIAEMFKIQSTKAASDGIPPESEDDSADDEQEEESDGEVEEIYTNILRSIEAEWALASGEGVVRAKPDILQRFGKISAAIAEDTLRAAQRADKYNEDVASSSEDGQCSEPDIPGHLALSMAPESWIRLFPAAIIIDPLEGDTSLDADPEFVADTPVAEKAIPTSSGVSPATYRPSATSQAVPSGQPDRMEVDPDPATPPAAVNARRVDSPEHVTQFESFDTSLLKLLAKEKHRIQARPRAREKARGQADTRALYDINVLRDWNNLRERLRRAGNRNPDVAAAKQIAATKATTCKNGNGLTKGPWFSRQLLRKARHVEAFGELPAYKQGHGARSKSPLDRPEVREAVEEFIASQGVGKCTPLKLQKHVNAVIAPKFKFKPISEKTAYNWMIKLGFALRGYRKGAYKDGHERPDVVAHRVGYGKFFESNDHLMRKYDDKTMEPLPLTLKPGERELVVVFHDESSFHANDQQSSCWLRKDEQLLRSKSRGRIVHVSDFIVEETGRLVLREPELAAQRQLPESERLQVTDARKIIHPGGGGKGDPYWNMEQLVAQVDNAMHIRHVLFPDKQVAWVFDNSSAHGAFSPDALIAHKMNVNPGGAQPKMHDTRIPDDNPNPCLRGKMQAMVFPEGHPNAGQAKGMEQVLRERGLYSSLAKGVRGKPVGVCATCKLSEEKRDALARKAKAAMDADPEGFASLADAMNEVDGHDEPDVRHNTDILCCMQRCLSQQSDFLSEKPLLQLKIEAAGDICLFLPKFHCELNPIELYWGWGKYRFRLRADGKFPTARKLVPEILDTCDIPTIRRFFRKTWRYLDGYRRGLTGKELESAVKKYKAHRKVPASAMMDISTIA